MAVGLGSYVEVLRDREARAFSLAGLVARMPMSMVTLGVVLLVSSQTGSFGRAGLVAAGSTVTAAVVAPLWGRLTDRVGQARVLLAAAAVNAVSLLALVATVQLGLPFALTLAAGVGVGLGFSLAGSSVRARWAHRLAGRPLLNTAFALEAMLDEVVFIVGPVLVTFLATAVHPALGLLVCVLLGTTGAALLAGQRATQPPSGGHRSGAGRVREPMPVARLLPLALVNVAIGAIFGGMEVVVVAFARFHGVLPYAGVLLLAWAVGSLLAGLVVGSVTWRASPARRFRVSAALLALSTLPLPFVHGPVLLAVLLLVSGFAISPTMIASTSVTQAVVPASRLTEAFGWSSTGLAAGLALGAATLGRLVDGWGPSAGFWGAVAAGAAVIALSLLVRTGPPAGPPAGVTPGPAGAPAAAPAPDGGRSRST